jgi:alpha-ribazole phosphatase
MKILSLVRHTSVNINPGICYGQLEVDVAQSFEKEAQYLKEWLYPADIVLASPSLRTKKLGYYLAEAFRCRLAEDGRLKEMHFGAWEGRHWRAISRSELDAWAEDVLNFVPPGGESAAAMLQRTGACLREILAMPQGHIVLVAHGGTIRGMLALLGNMDLRDTLSWQVDYGAVIQVRIEGELCK